MTRVRIDRIEGSELQLTNDGEQAVRIAYVSGLKGTPADRMRRVLEVANIPRLGEPHPTMGHLNVTAIKVLPDGPDAASVKITYRAKITPTGRRAVIEIGSSLTRDSTSTDIDGNAISVAYSPTGLDADLKTQGVQTPLFSPKTSLSFTRTESESPAQKARKYVGTINRTHVFDSTANTWLCTAISAKSVDGGRTYNVTYEFQYASDGWQPVVTYIDPATRRPPANLVSGVGIKTIEIYKQTEFKELGLQ